MKNFLRKLAVRVKLLSSFLLLASFVLILGTTSVILQKFIKKSNKNTSSSIVLSDAFFEGKYFLRSDMHIFKELIDAKNQEEFEYWWGEHIFQVQFFNDQLNKIEEEFNINQNLDDEAIRNKISVSTGDIRFAYNKNVLPLFEQFSELKREEFNLIQKQSMIIDSAELVNNKTRIQSIHEKYDIINHSVTSSGLDIITQLDAGKDVVRVLVENVNNRANILLSKSSNIVIWVTLFGLLFSIGIAMYISRLVTKPVMKILNHVNKLGIGEQPKKLEIILKDEFGEIQESLNKLTTSLVETTKFSNEIGNGNFESEFEPMSDNDVLGNSLLHMRDSLKKAKEEEDLRRIQDERQTWAANGVAKFSDIMRQTGESLTNLSYKLLSELVDYTNASQGSLFIINSENNDDIYYESTAAVAYGREKHIEAKIRLGEGLIGRAAYEALTIHLTEIPENYVHITSGLGEANPKVILLVPVKLEDKVNGVIELVSFNNFEKYKIDFVEKVCENIASFIESIKVNEQTAKLLSESKQQSEELAAQEEEMRQNLEELQATQEEVARVRLEDKEKTDQLILDVENHKKALLRILDHIPIKIFLKDNLGKMLIANKKVLDVHQVKPEDLLGKSDLDLIPDAKLANEYWTEEQNIIKANKPDNKIHEEAINDSKTILNTTKYPFYIDYLNEVGILGVQLDITETVKKDEEIEALKKQIKS